MSWEPLLAAPGVIQVDAFPALAALALGAFQLAAPKGTLRHRATGWLWVAIMLMVAVSSLWIHDIRQLGGFSLIHVLSIVALVGVPAAVYAAHRHRVAEHRRAMIMVFALALVGAGLFTLLPGRIMHDVVFGG